MKRIIPVILLSMFLVQGCWDYREINQSSIPAAIGLDLDESDLISFSVLLVQPLPPGELGSAKIEPVITSAHDHTVAMAGRRNLLSLSQVPEWSHVRAIVIGDRLVRKDLSLVIDFMARNRNIRPDIKLVIACPSSPEEIMSVRFPQVSDLGSGLEDLLSLNERQLGIYVPITLEEFTYRLATPGIEPAVPQITVMGEAVNAGNESAAGDKEGNSKDNKDKRIMLNGTAVFKGTKMVGSLNEDESRGYRWLNPVHKQGGLLNITPPQDHEKKTALEVITFHTRSMPRIDGDQVQIDITVDVELAYYEQQGNSLMLGPEMQTQIENLAIQEIEREIVACITRAQDLNSDIMGWGRRIYEYHPSDWQRLESTWPLLFPDVKPHIEVNATLKRTGLTRSSYEIN